MKNISLCILICLLTCSSAFAEKRQSKEILAEQLLSVVEEVLTGSTCTAITSNGCECSGDKACTSKFRNTNKRGGKIATCTSFDNSKTICEDDDNGGCSCSIT
jgi:hypothetical protein